MGAEVTHLSPWKWQAYCEQHTDGRNGSKATCEKWAQQHNEKEHKDEER